MNIIFIFINDSFVIKGDDDDDNDQTNDDPHKALGAINLDDLDVPTPSTSSKSRDIDSKKDQIVDLFNASEKNAKTKVKTKKSKEKKEKKSKKSKKSNKSDTEPESEVPEINGGKSNKKSAKSTHDQTDDLEFWLSPSKEIVQPQKTASKAEMEVESLPEKPAKKKHKKKSSKHDKHNNSEAQVNGVTNNISVTSNPALSLKLLASNSALKMSYDVKRVPMDPDKMTAGISFCNVGNMPISSIELDFVDTANIQVVRESPDRGIRLEMDLDAGKIEDHLFLFKVSSELVYPRRSAFKTRLKGL